MCRIDEGKEDIAFSSDDDEEVSEVLTIREEESKSADDGKSDEESEDEIGDESDEGSEDESVDENKDEDDNKDESMDEDDSSTQANLDKVTSLFDE